MIEQVFSVLVQIAGSQWSFHFIFFPLVSHSCLYLSINLAESVLLTMQFPPQIMNAPIELALDDDKSSPASQTTREVTETSKDILGIIFEYALNKFDDTKEQLAAGRPKFLSVIDQFVIAGTQVQMCLPGFPFKSANKIDKVFGILPDKAEQLALQRLHTMCLRIGDVYPPGAKLTVISDGLVYNGLSNTS